MIDKYLFYQLFLNEYILNYLDNQMVVFLNNSSNKINNQVLYIFLNITILLLFVFHFIFLYTTSFLKISVRFPLLSICAIIVRLPSDLILQICVTASPPPPTSVFLLNQLFNHFMFLLLSLDFPPAKCTFDKYLLLDVSREITSKKVDNMLGILLGQVEELLQRLGQITHSRPTNLTLGFKAMEKCFQGLPQPLLLANCSFRTDPVSYTHLTLPTKA